MKYKIVLLVAGAAALLDHFLPLHTGPITGALAPWIIPAVMAGLGFLGQMTARNRTIYEAGNPNYPGSTSRFPNPYGGGGGGGTSTTTQDVTTTQDTSTWPFFTPEFSNMGGLLRGIVEERLKNPTSLPPAFEAQGVQGINTTYEPIMRALGNRAALGYNVAPGVGLLEKGRASDIGSFRANLPIMNRQLQTEDIQTAANILNAFGKGQRTKGTSRTKGTTTTTGSGGGGGFVGLPSDVLQAHAVGDTGPSSLFSSIGNLLGFLWGQGAFGNQPSSQGVQQMPALRTGVTSLTPQPPYSGMSGLWG